MKKAASFLVGLLSFLCSGGSVALATYPDYASYSYIGWPYRSVGWSPLRVSHRPYGFIPRRAFASPALASPVFACRPFAYRTCYRPIRYAVPLVSVYTPIVPTYTVVDYSPQVYYPVPPAPCFRQDLFWPSVEIPTSPYYPLEVPLYSTPILGEPIEPSSIRIGAPIHQPRQEEVVYGLRSTRDGNGTHPVRLLTPTSSDWAEPAMKLTDMMLQEGDGTAAWEACERMMEIRNQLPTGIYLRHAILGALHGKDSSLIAESIRLAFESGSRLEPKELGETPLRTYVAPDSKLDLEATMNRLAERSLLSETRSANDLLVLGVLLRLDGQLERSRWMFLAAHEALNPPLQSVAADLMR